MAEPEEQKEEVRKRIAAFLKKNTTAVIATLSSNGEPNAATINYIIEGDDDFSIYFIARKSSRKYANLMQNNNVGLVVGTDPKIPAMAEVQGVAHLIETPNQNILDYFSKAIASGSQEFWPLLKAAKSMDYVFFKVEIQWLRWLDLVESEDFHTFRGDFYEITH
jgi:general stress protein 26